MILLQNAVPVIFRLVERRGLNRNCINLILLIWWFPGAVMLAGCTAVPIPKSSPSLNYTLSDHQNSAVEESVSIAVLGNTNVLISDGRHSVLVDGFFTRSNILTALFALRPDTNQIKNSLNSYNIAWNGEPSVSSGKLDVLVVTHAHFDHAMDAPVVGALTDTTIVGSTSVKSILQGYNQKSMNKVDMKKFINVKNAPTFNWKNDHYSIRLFESTHGGGRRFFSRSTGSMLKGQINNDLSPPASLLSYKQGDVYAVWVNHIRSGLTFLIQSTAGIATLPADLRADVTFLSLGNAAEMPPAEWEAYYETFVERPRAHLVIPIHWEDFFGSSISANARSNLTDKLAVSVSRLESRVQQDANAKLHWLKPHERLLLAH